jgi:TatD DNase family protein
LEQLLLETDAPYLAPSPFRGKRNEPLYLWAIVHKVASIFKISPNEVANYTRESTLEMFNIKPYLTENE